jgi:2-amino-4-hydroxy-6-hydroxymethyldihydropteridine diphosphokinase
VSSDSSQRGSSAGSRAYLGLGSNLGDRLAHLQLAVDELAVAAGVEVVAVSRVYETAPVGGPPQDPFLNAVAAVDTELDPYALLALAQRIEQDAQRVRIVRWGPRTLDVDVLLFDDLRLDDPDLTVPHPRMWERGFVLAPLRDVAPQLVGAAEAFEGVRKAPVILRLPWRNENAPSP